MDLKCISKAALDKQSAACTSQVIQEYQQYHCQRILQILLQVDVDLEEEQDIEGRMVAVLVGMIDDLIFNNILETI